VEQISTPFSRSGGLVPPADPAKLGEEPRAKGETSMPFWLMVVGIIVGGLFAYVVAASSLGFIVNFFWGWDAAETLVAILFLPFTYASWAVNKIFC
jgi:hypothetical protein